MKIFLVRLNKMLKENRWPRKILERIQYEEGTNRAGDVQTATRWGKLKIIIVISVPYL